MFVMAVCSSGAMTPALAPASTVAITSSLVIWSWLLSGTRIMRMIALASTVRSQTSGLRSMMSVTIGPMQRTATFSGQLMATRFGMRSANITKRIVTSRNEQKKETGVRASGGTT